MGLFKSVISRVKKGLERTREALVGGLRSLLAGRRLDDALIDDLERRLLEADVGPKATARLVAGVREAYRAGRMERGDEVLAYLKRELKAMWPEQDRALRLAPAAPTVILVTGINGVGKTTSIAKLAHMFKEEGRSVLVGACDTFRAGAVRQLEVWADRIGIGLVKGPRARTRRRWRSTRWRRASRRRRRGDPGHGRALHTQDTLMRELEKIVRVAGKHVEGAPHETLLVLDATSGQNALRQAEEFARAAKVTGIVLAKLDGTAKGGVVVAIRRRLTSRSSSSGSARRWTTCSRSIRRGLWRRCSRGEGEAVLGPGFLVLCPWS
ncbi:MAG: signaling recognition particle receptor family protein [Phycisphaerales bacterium]